jgi:hypothetical protein
MTPAVVVKNIILFVLLVLIGHFLVKNFLVDKELTKPQGTEVSHSAIINAIEKKDIHKEAVVAVEPKIAKPEKEPEGLDKAKAELLKFVDEEDNVSHLKKFFKESSSVPTDDCKSKIQTSQFPLSTTCDPNIQAINISAEMKKETPKKPKNCTNLGKNILVLNEYDNESVMNGGELFNGLNAFDSFDNQFQLLT